MTIGRITTVALGVFLIVVSVLWALFWGAVASLVSTFGGSDGGWVLISGALVLGILVFVLGVSLVRGRNPSGRVWLVWGALILAPLALLFHVFEDDHGASEVNSAVERTYVKRSHVRRANADCAYIEQNPDDSEFWVCTVETFGPSDYDVCNVDIRRFQAGNIKVRIYYCVNDDV